MAKPSLHLSHTVTTMVLHPSRSRVWMPEIKSLLYNTLVKEQNWRINKKNPSKLLSQKSPGNIGFLHDKFMKSSTWVVAAEDQNMPSCYKPNDSNLLGVMRLIENRPIEVAGYATKPSAKAVRDILDKYGDEGLVEINRFAISSKCVNKEEVGVDLLLSLLQYLMEKEDDRPVVAAVPLKYHWTPYTSIFLKIMKPFGSPFLYEDRDYSPAQLYIAQRGELHETFRLARDVEQELRRELQIHYGD